MSGRAEAAEQLKTAPAAAAGKVTIGRLTTPPLAAMVAAAFS
jgi:hypothetical protein